MRHALVTRNHLSRQRRRQPAHRDMYAIEQSRKLLRGICYLSMGLISARESLPAGVPRERRMPSIPYEFGPCSGQAGSVPLTACLSDRIRTCAPAVLPGGCLWARGSGCTPCDCGTCMEPRARRHIGSGNSTTEEDIAQHTRPAQGIGMASLESKTDGLPVFELAESAGSSMWGPKSHDSDLMFLPLAAKPQGYSDQGTICEYFYYRYA